jgi:8-oxo-dGTP pyrophosphatase MutT (NUDIX family)
MAHAKETILEDSEENYDNPFRQSSVLPFRIGKKGLEILMITSMKRKRWIIPKGIVEPDMTPAASAAKEALEEAGIEGDVLDQSIGNYHYKKWGGLCRCDVFPMRVTKIHDKWLEKDERSREWVPAATALKRIRHKKLRSIVRKFVDKRRDLS